MVRLLIYIPGSLAMQGNCRGILRAEDIFG